ncbi:hypothetical protein D3Y59_06015 [Hymenobacter oligotrophus]|uniref:Uncharacterized protein n=1 Tax=Hymenobacter oligotrophus TaxID=2319843 RepID=A0A3B7R021_9BACT|nr:hypothetical protein D3Y59_06015 [Hymenobacter oligotrophus]
MVDEFALTDASPNDDALDLGSGAPQPAAENLDASLCPLCTEPLGWHDTPCLSTQPATASASNPTFHYSPAALFAFDLGQAVQAAYNNRAHRIIWRGQVKERHPATGWVQRINVYRLNDGYWDCYREDDLQVA